MNATSQRDPELLQALELVLQRLDLPFPLALAEQALRQAPERPGERLDLAARAVGLRMVPLRGEPSGLVTRLGPGSPAMGLDRHGSWVVLDRDPAGLRLARPGLPPRRITEAGLQALLEVDAAGEALLALAEPQAAAAAMLGSGQGKPDPYERLWALIRAERQDLGVIVIYSIAVGALSLATPLATQALINSVAFTAPRQPIAVLALMLLVALSFAAVLRALRRVVVEILERRIFVRLAADLAWRLPRVRPEALERHEGPNLMYRFFDVLTVQKAASSLLIDGLGAVLQAAVGMLLLAIYHPLLLAFDVLLLGAVAVLLLRPVREATGLAVQESKVKYEVAGWLETVARNPRIFRLPGGPDLALDRTDRLARLWLDKREKQFKVWFRQVGGALGLQAVASAILLGGGGWLVVEGQLGLGQLVAAELIVTAALAGIVKVAEKLESLYDVAAAMDKLGLFGDLPLEPALGTPTGPDPGPAALTFYGVPWGEDTLGINLSPGGRALLTVRDGASADQLVNRLTGDREGETGQILLDGVDIRQLQPEGLHATVAAVRGPLHFNGTLRDNLTLGRNDCSEEHLREILTLLGLEARVAGLPKGLDTWVGNGGHPLGTEDRVRVAIIRAILCNPRILVVDRVLDILSPNERRGLITTLSAPTWPWTLLILTRNGENA